MAEITQLEKIDATAEQNAETAAKLADQGRVVKADTKSTEESLDAMLAKKTAKPETKVEAKEEVKPEGEAKSKAEKAETKPEVRAKTEPKPEAAAKVEAKAEKVEAAPDPAVEAHRKRADELFKDSPSLPANASPKSNDAFSSVKIKAAQEISAREADIEKLRKENEGLQAKIKEAGQLPPEVSKELEDHRTWRAKLDIEADPKFKSYDKTVSDAQEFIYSQLRKSPAVTDAVIAEIKKHGGPENVQLEKLFDAIADPTIKRLVESKVADIEMAKFSKDQAIKVAKENVNQYLTERQKAWESAATAHNTATQNELENLTGNLKWLADKQGDEEHNKFVGEVKGHLANALKDDSPQMRAIMLTGMAQLLHLQRVHESAIVAHEAEKKAHEETKSALAEATAALDKLKNASVSRLRESAAPPGGKLPEAKKDFDMRKAPDALDAIAKQIMEERNRVQNVG